MLFENRTEIYLFLLVSKNILYKSFAFPGRLSTLSSTHDCRFPSTVSTGETDGKHMRGGSVYRAGMGIVGEVCSSVVTLEITVVLRLLNPCVLGWTVSYMKKLQASISRQSSQTRHKWKKMDQNKAG